MKGLEIYLGMLQVAEVLMPSKIQGIAKNPGDPEKFPLKGSSIQMAGCLIWRVGILGVGLQNQRCLE